MKSAGRVIAALVGAGVISCGGGGNGGSPVINTTTAPIIAGETYSTAVELGNIGLLVGQQFGPFYAFGKLAATNPAPGIVPPTDFLCGTSGFATVSGNIQASGTFTAGDTLTAEFTDCLNGTDFVSGRIDVTVTSFSETDIGFGAYFFTGTATLTDLDRGSFIANGQLTNIWDATELSGLPAQLLWETSTSGMQFKVGSITRSLADAQGQATLAITNGFPTTLTGNSSGTISTSELPGSFTYETLSLFAEAFDSDPLTGPDAGTLWITAADGSAVTLEAVNNMQASLGVDSDGDGVVEDTLSAPWAEIQ